MTIAMSAKHNRAQMDALENRKFDVAIEARSEPFYRWVIVGASSAILAVVMGVMVNGISVFFIPLNEEFGWLRASVSLINVSGLVGLAVGGIVMGRIADRTTTRRISLFGATVFGVCLLVAAHIDALWQFYVVFFIAGFLGGGALFAPLVANVGNWFKTGAGLALGITAAGQALGQGGVPFGTAVFIGAFGWRGALSAMGALALMMLVPLAMLIRQPPILSPRVLSDPSWEEDASPVALPTGAIVTWLSAAVVFCCTCMSVPLMHLVPLIQDCGFSAEQASSVAFLMMMIAILGRITFGKLADIIGAIPAYMVASFWQTVLVLGFIQFQGLYSFYSFAAIYGFGYAGVMTGILVCVRTLTPVARRASALGVVMVFAWLGHAIGGYQGGYYFDLTGAYTNSFLNAALAGVVNLTIVGALYFTIALRGARLVMKDKVAITQLNETIGVDALRGG
jgi:MFS family permease